MKTKKTIFIITYLLLGVFFLTNCKKEKSKPLNNTTNEQITINSSRQFSGTINGVNYTYVEGSSDVAAGVGASKSLLPSPETSTAVYQSFLYYDSSGTGIMGINKGTMYFNAPNPVDSSFKGFFLTGNYSYSANGINGIEIYWIDSTGSFWNTSYGTADQTGHSFNIDEIQEFNIWGSYLIKIKATFSCTLYNSSGQAINLDNGIYVGSFENI